MQISEVMMLLGGLGLFLYGMKLMGDGLEMAAGSRLKKIVEKLTRNKYMGALVGLHRYHDHPEFLFYHGDGSGIRKRRAYDAGTSHRRNYGRQHRNDGYRFVDCHQAQ